MRSLLLLSAAAALAGACPAGAQIPDRFENLQVLPREIPRDSLVQVMRGFSRALGVRCVHCHLATRAADGTERLAFASDDVRAKRTARLMMRMVRDLNTRVLAELPERSSPPVQVGCITCHRGMPLPVTIEAVLSRTVDSAGVEAAIARYRKLRAENLDRGRFDFGEDPVGEVARRLAATGRPAEAVALLRMNAEFHPSSAAIDLQLGDVFRGAGDAARAAEHYRRALEKEPGNAQARRRLQELGSPAPR